jgi:membrane protease subunit HflK
VLQAQGDVAQFTAVLQEYRKAEDVTRERLYLETIERVLGSIDKIVIDESVAGNTLPFLPLDNLAAARRSPGDEEQQSRRTQPSTSPTAPLAQPTVQPVPTVQP